MFGETDAVVEPDIILSNCKSSSASNGILYNPPPSPRYKDAVIDCETCNEPLNSILTEPELTDVSKFSTLKNPNGSTDAVTEPVNIFDESIAKLAISIFVIPLPSPVITPPTFNDSEIFTEPLSDVNILPVSPVSNTLNSPVSEIDAVYEPVSNLFNVNAKLAISISVNPLPSPTNLPPPPTVIEPDEKIEPVNCEPLLGAVTINVSPLATDAVAEPLDIRGAAAAFTFSRFEPSPK